MTSPFFLWGLIALMMLIVFGLLVQRRRLRWEMEGQAMTIKAGNTLLSDSNSEISWLRAQRALLIDKMERAAYFNYDLTQAPSGELQLLTAGGTKRIEPLGGVDRALAMGVVAWAPTALRDRDEEIRRGLIPAPKAG